MEIKREKKLFQLHTKENEHYNHTKVSIEYTIESLNLILIGIRYETDAIPLREEIKRLEEIIFAWDFPDKLKSV